MAYFFLVTVTLFLASILEKKIVKNVLSSVVKTLSTNVSNSRPITLQGHLSRNKDISYSLKKINGQHKPGV